MAEEKTTIALTVLWPIPTTTSLFEAIHQVQTIMKAQYPESEVRIYGIFVGNPELGKLVFQDVGKLVHLTYFADSEMVKPGYMEITFAKKAK